MYNLNADVITAFDNISRVHKWNIGNTIHLNYLKDGLQSPIFSDKNMHSIDYQIHIGPFSQTKCSCQSYHSSCNCTELPVGLLFRKNVQFATPLTIEYSFKKGIIQKQIIQSATKMKLCGIVKFSKCPNYRQIEDVEILTCSLSYVIYLTTSLDLLLFDKKIKKPQTILSNDSAELEEYTQKWCTASEEGIQELFESNDVTKDVHSNDFLHKIYEQVEFSDMTIYANGESFYIHTSILSYYPYFKDLIFKTKSKGNINTHIQDIEPHLFKYILRYIYTGVDEDIMSVPHQILPIVKKLNITTLEEKCVQKLQDELTIDNLISTLTTATEINANNLLLDIKKFLIKNISTISKSSEYEHLKQYYPDLLVQVLDSIMTS